MAMKILIVSDSHGNNRNLIQAVKNMSGTMDMMIHLGDMECSPDRIRELVDCPVELVKEIVIMAMNFRVRSLFR